MKSQRVVVVGQGYVGLPVAMLAVARGFEVTGYDVDADRVARLRAGRSFIGDVPDARLQASLQSGLYRVNADEDELRGFDIAVIAVPTPALAGEPDLSYVESAAKALAVHLRPGATVILESTTWPGTTEEVVVPLLETSGLRAGADFAVGYSPERINPGDGLAGMAAVPKVVSGIDAASLQQVAGFWAALVETVVAAPDIRTAEFSKLLENVFRLVNVSLVNELTQHAGALGVDMWEAVRLAATKPYGYMPFTPSAGAGGHCLPVDTKYLTWCIRQTGGVAAVVEAADEVNARMPGWVAGRIVAGLAARGHRPAGARVLAIGITYKRDVADTRESCAIQVVAALRTHGIDVQVYDPLVAVDRADVTGELTAAMIQAADAVVVLVDHSCVDLEMIAEARYVFDARGCLAGRANVEVL